MRILVVDDEAVIAQAVADGLRGDGYAVDVAARGDDGLRMALDTAYDAIVLDVMLPGMNGYAVCRALRAEGIDTPILMLTAKDGEYDQAEGLDTGADDYLTKPFSFVVLAARLRALLRRGPTDRSTVLRAGTLSLDPATHEVRRGDTRIELTPREFTLLRYLLHHHGRVVTKQELIDRVWGDDLLDPNVVQVYVGYLRRKIDEPFGTATIQTTRGVGYRVVSDRT